MADLNEILRKLVIIPTKDESRDPKTLPVKSQGKPSRTRQNQNNSYS